jgi:hypothetical protein
MTARYFPCSMSSFREEDVLLRGSRRDLKDDFLVSDPRGPQAQDQIPEPVGCKVPAAPLQRAFGAPERVLTDCVEDEVEAL